MNRKVAYFLLVIAILFPTCANAAWWNPLGWGRISASEKVEGIKVSTPKSTELSVLKKRLDSLETEVSDLEDSTESLRLEFNTFTKRTYDFIWCINHLGTVGVSGSLTGTDWNHCKKLYGF